MRTAIVCSAILAMLVTTGAAGAAATRSTSARLAGRTMIDVGCPVSPGARCDRWQPLPHAAFTVTRLDPAGQELPGTTRTVKSNAAARFRIVLHVGNYLVKPRSGKISRGGLTFRLRVRANATTTTTVRFASRHLRV